METPFEKIGGEAAVDLFYAKVLADDLIQQAAAIGESTRNDILNR